MGNEAFWNEGFVKGLQHGVDSYIEQNKFKVQEELADRKARALAQQLDQQTKDKLATKANKFFDDYRGMLTKTIEQGGQEGGLKLMTKLAQSPGIQNAILGYNKMLVAAGLPERDFGTETEAIITSSLTTLDAAKKKGEAAGTEAIAAAPGKVAAAKEMIPVDVEKAKKVEQAKTEVNPPSQNTITFLMPDGSKKEVNSRDSKAVSDAIAAGGNKITQGVQASNAAGLTGESPKTLADLRSQIRTTQGNIEELNNLSAKFKALPQAGGVMGSAIETIGGLMQQVPLLKDVPKGITGVDPAEVTAVRTQARVAVSTMLSTITQEKGKFSDSERKLASEALKALDVNASAEQINAALATARDVMERSQIRNLDRIRIEGKFDLQSRDGVNGFHNTLLANGYTTDEADKAIAKLITRLGYQ